MASSSLPPPAPRRSKTETLSLRLDPKVKFMLDFIARIRGQNITTAVERAILEAADRAKLGDQFDGDSWSKFWDPDEGVRAVKLLVHPLYPKTYDEDEIVAFMDEHWEFFYSDSSNRRPKNYAVGLLWPDISKYVDIWRSTRHHDFWAAGEAMKAALEEAKLAPPEWPRPPAKKPESKQKRVVDTTRESFSQDLDDEIPF